jgi:hypothetical protein
MSDVIEGLVTPGVANAAVNAGGKLLKMVDMQIKYGTVTARDGHRELALWEQTGRQPAVAQDVTIKDRFAKLRQQLDAEEAAALNGQVSGR